MFYSVPVLLEIFKFSKNICSVGRMDYQQIITLNVTKGRIWLTKGRIWLTKGRIWLTQLSSACAVENDVYHLGEGRGDYLDIQNTMEW